MKNLELQNKEVNKMKKWIVKMWRSNPQLKNGGYETTRKVEARIIYGESIDAAIQSTF